MEEHISQIFDDDFQQVLSECAYGAKVLHGNPNTLLHEKLNKFCKIIEMSIREEMDRKISDAVKVLSLETEEKLRVLEEKLNGNIRDEEDSGNNSTLIRIESNDIHPQVSTLSAARDVDENDKMNIIQREHNSKRSCCRRLLAFLKRSEVEFRVNSTIHAFATFSLINRHWTMSVMMILISFAFLALQYGVLSATYIESFYPTCSAHADCKVGTYCGSFSHPLLVHTSKY